MLAPETPSARWWNAAIERHRQTLVLFWGPILALAGIIAVAVLLDARVSHALMGWPDTVRAFFRLITDLGKSDWMLIPALIALIVCAIALRFKLSYSWAWAARGLAAISGYLFATVAISGLVTVVFKRLIGRARPMYLDELGPLYFKPFDIFDWSFHSFPSGHATTIVAFSVVIYTFSNGRFRNWIIAFGVLIGLSRIVVGDHYLSDVIAGSFVGLSTALVIRDYFVTRGWGMRIVDGRVRYRMFAAFRPLWRRLTRSYRPMAAK